MIPINLTTISVSRIPADPTRDGYDTPPAATTVASGVRAVIGAPSGSQNVTFGDRTVVTFPLRCDPTDIQPADTITDETTGDTYVVQWARTRTPALGLDYTEGQLEQVRGAS